MFSNGSYLTVWKAEQAVNRDGAVIPGCANAYVTSSKKNQDGTYENDFDDYVRFYDTKSGGRAASNLLAIKRNGDQKMLARIKITNCAVVNNVVKPTDGVGQWKRYYNFLVFGWEMADQYRNNGGEKPQGGKAKSTVKMNGSFPDMEIPDDVVGEEMPF